MIKTNRGYNLVMWTATFTALLAAAAFIQISVKRALQDKIIAASDYVLWDSWDEEVQIEPSEKTSRSKVISYKQQHIFKNEKHSDETFPTSEGSIITYGTDEQSQELKISSEVEEGSESLLSGFSLNYNE